jgi:hypothetical protein
MELRGVCRDNGRILLANLFPRDTAAIAALDSPGSCTFNNGICEAQFSALGGSPTVSIGFVRHYQEACVVGRQLHRVFRLGYVVGRQ